MPFEHSESLAVQEKSMRLFENLAAEHPEMTGHVEYARQHLDVIRRFGRFPYRNAVLGRTSTPAEMEYLRRST